MKENFTGINRVYTKDRFMYEVYINGKCIGTKLKNDDAEDLLYNELEKVNSNAVDFTVELRNILEKYKVNMKFEDSSVLVTFNDDVTVPFVVDGNNINTEVLDNIL